MKDAQEKKALASALGEMAAQLQASNSHNGFEAWEQFQADTMTMCVGVHGTDSNNCDPETPVSFPAAAHLKGGFGALADLADWAGELVGERSYAGASFCFPDCYGASVQGDSYYRDRGQFGLQASYTVAIRSHRPEDIEDTSLVVSLALIAEVEFQGRAHRR